MPDLLSLDKEVKREAKCHAVIAEPAGGATREFLSYYSPWYKLTRAMAWIIRFKEWLKALQLGRTYGTKGDLRVDEIRAAETHIVLYVQRTTYKRELESLDSQGAAPRNSPIMA